MKEQDYDYGRSSERGAGVSCEVPGLHPKTPTFPWMPNRLNMQEKLNLEETEFEIRIEINETYENSD